MGRAALEPDLRGPCAETDAAWTQWVTRMGWGLKPHWTLRKANENVTLVQSSAQAWQNHGGTHPVPWGRAWRWKWKRPRTPEPGVLGVAEADRHVHHCCALLVGHYKSKYLFFNWMVHPIRNQNFTRTITWMHASAPQHLKEVLEFLKSFGFLFQFKKSGHFRK